jgi:hypothetical protein
MGAPTGWNSCSLDDSGDADKSTMCAASPERPVHNTYNRGFSGKSWEGKNIKH